MQIYVQAIRKTTRRQARSVAGKLRNVFAPYLVQDDYGTHRRCWTRSEAESWIPYCSARSRVVNLLSGV